MHTGKSLGSLAPLSEAIVQHARERGRITMGEAIRLTHAQRPTLKSHFARLVERGSLVRHGTGKGTWYAPTVGPAGGA